MTRRSSGSREVVESGALAIGALARASGIPAETLRTWERRYGAPRAVRKPSGHRVYPASAVEHLRKVASLLARGHRPAEVLALPAGQLDALLGLSEIFVAPALARGAGDTAATPDANGEGGVLLRAAAALDRHALMEALRAAWSRYGPLEFLTRVAGPFMADVGEAWSDGRLEIRHEHFASAALGDFLREVREPYERVARGPRIAAATLPGDLHAGGLLMAALLLALRGYQLVYLGPDTPIDQLDRAVRRGDADAVVLSVSAAVPRARATRTTAALRRRLPRRVPLWLGGAGAPEPPGGAERFESLAAFDARLGRWP